MRKKKKLQNEKVDGKKDILPESFGNRFNKIERRSHLLFPEHLNTWAFQHHTRNKTKKNPYIKRKHLFLNHAILNFLVLKFYEKEGVCKKKLLTLKQKEWKWEKYNVKTCLHNVDYNWYTEKGHRVLQH